MVMKNKHTSRVATRQSGFSLVEILVAAVILGTVLTGLMTILSYSIKSNNQAQIRTVARDRTQDGIDFIRSQKEVLRYAGMRQILEGMAAGDSSIDFCLESDDTNASSTDINNHIFDDLSEPPSCSTIEANTGTEMTRVVTFDLSVPDEIGVEVSVSWPNSADETVRVVSNTVLKSW